MPDTAQILQALVNGLSVGCIYGLIGIGFAVIYNASGIVNFAQGVFVMLGGMVTHALLTLLGLPMVVSAALSIVIVMVMGLIVEFLVIRPMWVRNAPLYAIILATLACQIMVEKLAIILGGDQPRTFPSFTAGGPFKIGDVAINYQALWILGCSVILVGLLWAFFAHTRIGRALRACAQNREAAALLGIPVMRMLALSFALSAGLGAIAGILITPTQYTAFNVGEAFGISGFIAAIMGGFGSAFGALIGGVLLGVVQALAIVMFGASFKNIIALSMMLVVLVFFPNGLLKGFKRG
jgi:branched-chain amino acid transport system permease protein